MKNITRLIFSLSLASAALLARPCAATPGQWEYAGSLGTARGSHTATLLPNGKVLVAGGHNYSSRFLSSAEVDDPASGTRSRNGSPPTARHSGPATLLPPGKVPGAAGSGTWAHMSGGSA